MNFDKNKIVKYVVIGVMAIAVLSVVFFAGRNSVKVNVCKPEAVDFSLFWDAYNKLHQSFINPEKIDDQEVMYGAIFGMTRSLGDPYTDFFNPDQARAFQQDLAGSFDGIGVEVAIKKDQLMVVAPLKGTPGEKAGLKSGDLILNINGKSTSDMSTEEAVRLIRGKKGTVVTLTIFRQGWTQSKDISIVRDTIKVDSMNWELKNPSTDSTGSLQAGSGQVAYISIHQFDQSLPADFRQAASEILRSPAKKIIVDLRNNPGGYLEVSQEIAGWFLKSGQTVTIEDYGKAKSQDVYKADGNGAFVSYPVVVLINKGSASASEILAGALRDNRNVKLIGGQSFGKGSVQEVVPLSDGKSLLKVTIAHWLTPKGTSISEVGLMPDVKVEMSDEDAEAQKDPQLTKALEIIGGIK